MGSVAVSTTPAIFGTLAGAYSEDVTTEELELIKHYCLMFLRSGGKVSIEEWSGLNMVERVALAAAGDQLHADRLAAALVVSEPEVSPLLAALESTNPDDKEAQAAMIHFLGGLG